MRYFQMRRNVFCFLMTTVTHQIKFFTAVWIIKKLLYSENFCPRAPFEGKLLWGEERGWNIQKFRNNSKFTKKIK